MRKLSITLVSRKTVFYSAWPQPSANHIVSHNFSLNHTHLDLPTVANQFLNLIIAHAFSFWSCFLSLFTDNTIKSCCCLNKKSQYCPDDKLVTRELQKSNSKKSRCNYKAHYKVVLTNRAAVKTLKGLLV